MGVYGLPVNPACQGRHQGACTGFSGGYDTYHCGCRCHWRELDGEFVYTPVASVPP